MIDHIIPLAEATNAIIITHGGEYRCGLNASLMRMIGVHGARWGSRPPFSILTIMGGSFSEYYFNKDKNATWCRMRAASKNWRKREEQTAEGPDGKQRKYHWLKLVEEWNARELEWSMDQLLVDSPEEYIAAHSSLDISPFGQNYVSAVCVCVVRFVACQSCRFACYFTSVYHGTSIL